MFNRRKWKYTEPQYPALWVIFEYILVPLAVICFIGMGVSFYSEFLAVQDVELGYWANLLRGLGVGTALELLNFFVPLVLFTTLFAAFDGNRERAERGGLFFIAIIAALALIPTIYISFNFSNEGKDTFVENRLDVIDSIKVDRTQYDLMVQKATNQFLSDSSLVVSNLSSELLSSDSDLEAKLLKAEAQLTKHKAIRDKDIANVPNWVTAQIKIDKKTVSNLKKQRKSLKNNKTQLLETGLAGAKGKYRNSLAVANDSLLSAIALASSINTEKAEKLKQKEVSQKSNYKWLVGWGVISGIVFSFWYCLGRWLSGSRLVVIEDDITKAEKALQGATPLLQKLSIGIKSEWFNFWNDIIDAIFGGQIILNDTGLDASKVKTYSTRQRSNVIGVFFLFLAVLSVSSGLYWCFDSEYVGGSFAALCLVLFIASKVVSKGKETEVRVQDTTFKPVSKENKKAKKKAKKDRKFVVESTETKEPAKVVSKNEKQVPETVLETDRNIVPQRFTKETVLTETVLETGFTGANEANNTEVLVDLEREETQVETVLDNDPIDTKEEVTFTEDKTKVETGLENDKKVVSEDKETVLETEKDTRVVSGTKNSFGLKHGAKNTPNSYKNGKDTYHTPVTVEETINESHASDRVEVVTIEIKEIDRTKVAKRTNGQLKRSNTSARESSRKSNLVKGLSGVSELLEAGYNCHWDGKKLSVSSDKNYTGKGKANDILQEMLDNHSDDLMGTELKTIQLNVKATDDDIAKTA